MSASVMIRNKVAANPELREGGVPAKYLDVLSDLLDQISDHETLVLQGRCWEASGSTVTSDLGDEEVKTSYFVITDGGVYIPGSTGSGSVTVERVPLDEIVAARFAESEFGFIRIEAADRTTPTALAITFHPVSGNDLDEMEQAEAVAAALGVSGPTKIQPATDPAPPLTATPDERRLGSGPSASYLAGVYAGDWRNAKDEFLAALKPDEVIVIAGNADARLGGRGSETRWAPYFATTRGLYIFESQPGLRTKRFVHYWPSSAIARFNDDWMPNDKRRVAFYDSAGNCLVDLMLDWRVSFDRTADGDLECDRHPNDQLRALLTALVNAQSTSD